MIGLLLRHISTWAFDSITTASEVVDESRKVSLWMTLEDEGVVSGIEIQLQTRMRRYKFELAGLNDWRQYRCASVAQTLDSISDDRRQAVR